MNHNASVGQGVPHARRSRSQEQAAHAGRLADTPGGDGIEDVLHSVINGQACCYHTALGKKNVLIVIYLDSYINEI